MGNPIPSQTYGDRRKVLAVVCLALTWLAAGVFAQQAITFQYIYDDLNRLVEVIDSTGVAIRYIYDPAGNNVQIVRSTVTPGALTIFNVTPGAAFGGATLTIQGQGFSATASNNIVTVNGLALLVISATPTTLLVQIPTNATSGVISVTVGGVTVTSLPESILPLPDVQTLTPKSALAGAPFTLTVTGRNFAGATFSFTPPLTITSTSVDPGGTSATLVVSPAASIKGYFTLIGANAAGSSTAIPQVGFLPAVTAFNTVSIPGSSASADADRDGIANGQEIANGTDPLNPDTDGDGYVDGLEAQFGSDPLNPASIPVIPASGAYLASQPFTMLNSVSPVAGVPQTLTVSGLPFAILDSESPVAGVPQTFTVGGVPFAILDSTVPAGPSPQTYAISGLTFSLLNSVSPSLGVPQTYDIGGLLFSIFNGTLPVPPASASLRFLLPINPAFLMEALARGAQRIDGKPVCTDTDGDGICDADELRIGTNPYLVDSDGDGYPDGLELALGSDPLDPKSIPDIRSPGYLATPPVSIRNTSPIAKLAPRQQGAIDANNIP